MNIEFESKPTLISTVLDTLRSYYYPDCIQVARTSLIDRVWYEVTVNEKSVMAFWIYKEV